MTLPADPTWDSNDTNTVATVAGHVTDGYADDEVPTAAETNGWMRTVALWIIYLSNLPQVVRYRWLPAASGRPSESPYPAPTIAANGAVKANGAISGMGFFPVGAAVGDIVTKIAINYLGDGVNTVYFRLSELDGAGTLNYLDATLGGNPATGPAVWSTVEVELDTPYTVQQGKTLTMGFYFDGGTSMEVSGIAAAWYTPLT